MIDFVNRMESPRSRRLRLSRTRLALGLVASLLSAACSDTSGPGSVDANGALESLARWLQSSAILTPGALETPDISAALGDIAPLVTQASVTIDGASQPMYAIGLRETLPAGTCEEDLFADPAFPGDPATCTEPFLNTTLIFWQSHSANALPDRMLFIVADAGTVSFDFTGDVDAGMPAVALYLQGEDDAWASLSGSLTNNVTGESQSCAIQLPPYAKSGTCHVASFDEQGQIVVERFTDDGPSLTQHKTIVLQNQTLRGLWLDITEVQPVTLPFSTYTRGVGPLIRQSRLSALAPRFIRAR